jgi:hypothetical protein
VGKHSTPETGDGRTQGFPLSLRDITFRRSAKDNAGLASDVQHANTARFQAENGIKPPKQRRRFG